MTNYESRFDAVGGYAFNALLITYGMTVYHDSVGVQAIKRENDEVYSEEYGGFVIRLTFEFHAQETPPDGATIVHGDQAYRVEGVVLKRPGRRRVAVSEVASS